ncbi:hypothetical protein GobsT_13910 [Gemmata obscuriglobus]|nr:hypothetical protein GobsT_13910 [Gemmata obscuriglobus]VTS02226.1 Uncharacterized protein OS=Bacteroides oleiciplenus YIT 12058 GN=HMPREF9447_04402 PE=4 SV=1 [Gemmata obscuriglobus UQM 2246]
MWPDTPFEKQLKTALKKINARGDVLAGNFASSKKFLVENVYEEIKREERHLSDHGPRHIVNVLENIGTLLGKEYGGFSPEEMYCLGMITLFHDVGNMYGRKEHQDKIKQIYTRARAGANEDKSERVMVLMAAKAHTGEASDGSKDTLKDLDNRYYFQGSIVRLQEIAAILRMADELAEGPQRTSRLVLETHGYDESSRIYHRYATCVHVSIDRERGLFALDYHFAVDPNAGDIESALADIKELIEFSYKRLLKLDQERSYTKFYCPALSPFKASSATYRFWIGDDECGTRLPALYVDDKVVPGVNARSVPQINPLYEPATIIEQLRGSIQQRNGGVA